MSESQKDNSSNSSATENNGETKPKIYFGIQKTEVFYFDESKDQFIEFKKMNEGERQEYEDTTGHQISMDKNSDNVKMNLSTGKDRAVLLGLVMVKYSIYIEEAGKSVLKEGSDKGVWKHLISQMDGELAQRLFEEIKKLNTWIKASEEEVKVEQKKD